MSAIPSILRGLQRLRIVRKLSRWSDFAVSFRHCAFCGPGVFLRLCKEATGVRCLRCGASAVHLSLGNVLRHLVPDLHRRDACELSARGPLATFLRRSTRSTATSEYFVDVQPGDIRDGIRCEDVQRLTYPTASFDVITHTEVLEHVPDEGRALAELWRTLRPGGIMLFTVPFHSGEHTIERALLCDGELVHLQPPVYHMDPLRGGAGILAYRDYGNDILDRLRRAGFVETQLRRPTAIPWDCGRPVVTARRPV